ncbi:TetR/AcrR family transcriptional regulator [Amycolatopsis anabasis]|uniref:TetR/AcrR family transcriptional regulator n=1 Tax=Amycolatopsis anabasis TaxID=1840409 RepID=UPI00131D7CDD|nr:TetR/AcrR family transcriptional regulator [Amycolatopsis anabasis]
MPKRVDHEQRRAQIAEAVWRIARDRGLEDVTLRQVAAEAGVSTRLVQYYFGTRNDLLLGALKSLNERQERRVQQQIAEAGAPDLRGILRGILSGMLPADEESRTTTLVHIAYFVRALGDPELAEAFRQPASPTLEELFVMLLEDARGKGQLAPGLDLAREADTLLAIPAGLTTEILLGQRTVDDVLAVVDYNLDRIFTRD